MKVTLQEDKTICVPPGQTVKTGYVPVHHIVLACKDRMAVGDVDRAYQRLIQIAPNQAFPCPIGHWEEDNNFVIIDGRHTYVAALMLGFEYILVAWEDNE